MLKIILTLIILTKLFIRLDLIYCHIASFVSFHAERPTFGGRGELDDAICNINRWQLLD